MEYFHLTTPQQNIWNLQKYYEDTAIANLCGAVFYQEKRERVLLQRAICQFIHSQSGMRLCFCEHDEPMQYVTDDINDAIPVLSFETMQEFDHYAKEFAKVPFDSIDCALYRFVVFEVENRSGILVVLSHLIADAWTFGLMANQVDKAYHILAENAEDSLIEANYIDYVNSESEYLKSDRYARDQKYWEEKYAVSPEKSPIKLCTTVAASVKAKRITRVLPESLEEKINLYCKESGVTPAVLFETALVSGNTKFSCHPDGKCKWR